MTINGKTVTCTNGNGRNNIAGSRITVKAADGTIIDRFVVPARNGVRYCQDHPSGAYGKRFAQAVA